MLSYFHFSSLIVKFIIAYNLPFMAHLKLFFMMPFVLHGEIINCIKILEPRVPETMCRQFVWHSFILVFNLLPFHFVTSLCSLFFFLRGVYNTKINFFAQNNIQFSIITLLLSNSRSRFPLSQRKKYINYIKLIFLFSALRNLRALA